MIMGISFTQRYNCNKCGKSYSTNTDDGVRYSIVSIEYDTRMGFQQLEHPIGQYCRNCWKEIKEYLEAPKVIKE